MPRILFEHPAVDPESVADSVLKERHRQLCPVRNSTYCGREAYAVDTSNRQCLALMKIYEFLEDNTGAFSATRLGFLLWVVGALVTWIVDSVLTQHLQGLDGSIITIIGILMSGKVVQSFSENLSATKTATNPPADLASNAADNGQNKIGTSPAVNASR